MEQISPSKALPLADSASCLVVSWQSLTCKVRTENNILSLTVVLFVA